MAETVTFTCTYFAVTS